MGVSHQVHAIYGSIEWHKACPITKVFSLIEVIEYFETFSPINKMDLVHLIIFIGL